MSNATVTPIKDEDYGEVEALIESLPGDLKIVVDDTVRPRKVPVTLTDRCCYLPGEGSLGQSIIFGLLFAKVRNARRTVVIDAGWSHDPADIARLTAVQADVVIGSRFAPDGEHKGSWWRSAGSRAVAAAFNLRHGTNIRDWTSGYRAYSLDAIRVIQKAHLTSERHAIQAEMLQACVRAQLTIREVPITYRPGSGSSFNLDAVKEIVALWIRSWRA